MKKTVLSLLIIITMTVMLLCSCKSDPKHTTGINDEYVSTGNAMMDTNDEGESTAEDVFDGDKEDLTETVYGDVSDDVSSSESASSENNSTDSIAEDTKAPDCSVTDDKSFFYFGGSN